MSYYRFKKNDIFYNTIKAHPSTNLSIHSGNIYHNNRNMEAGAFTDPVTHVPLGNISLYEINVDRPPDGLVYPFVTKAGSLTTFRTISTSGFNNDFIYGDVMSGSYPLSASVSRDYVVASSANKRLAALKNSINFYRPLSPHYQFSGVVEPGHSRNLAAININMITVPSIFYGSKIKPGTVDLKFFVTGTMVGHAKDEKRNGELVQVGPLGSTNSGSVIGLAMYNEGFMLLTASHSLSTHTEIYKPIGTATSPSWINFATTGSAASVAASSSFDINFEGTTRVPTLTMFAHAKKAELNHSNNFSFLDHDSYSSLTDSVTNRSYREPEYTIKNTVKSPYNDPTASFQKQTYISRIGIYDEDRNLIAIAKVATPVRKRESDSYTFKLKLDI